jgi:hypothetical protein
MDQAPLLEEGTNRTVVPDRFIAEAAGYKVDWNEEQQMITFSK